MAQVYKILGQLSSTSTGNRLIYTCPVSADAVVSTVFICHRGSTAGTYRFAATTSTAAPSTDAWLAFDVGIAANDFVALTVGITLSSGETIHAQGGTTAFSYTAFGSEIT